MTMREQIATDSIPSAAEDHAVPLEILREIKKRIHVTRKPGRRMRREAPSPSLSPFMKEHADTRTAHPGTR